MAKDKSFDVLGVKPVGEAIKSAVDGSIAAASAFLSRICLPAAEEFGLLLKDKVSAWRADNLLKITAKAKEKLEVHANADLRAHPRLITKAIEDGSWASDDDVQEMWAGLLASSCTTDGEDDSNLLFMSLLSQLSVPEVRLLTHSCETADKYASDVGWIRSGDLEAEVQTLRDIMAVQDDHRIDRELDHLRALELLTEHGGFAEDSTQADITPTALALQLYVRCQGYIGSPVEFFGAQPRPQPAVKGADI